MPSAQKSAKVRASAHAFQHSRNGLREAILGLLAIRPMSGYDLSRSYQRALQQIWYAPLGQIYPTLRKMQSDGLLRVTVKVQHDRPNRKVYSLTAEGRKLLVLWLLQPALLPRMHHEFLHKLFLLGSVDPARRGQLVDDYIGRCTAWVTELRRTERMLEPSLKGPNAENAWFQLQSLCHLCRIVECEADSARRIANEIRAYSVAKGRRPAAPLPQDHAAFAGLALSPAGHARSGT
jgi:PadR family transcriptional regulator AphA